MLCFRRFPAMHYLRCMRWHIACASTITPCVIILPTQACSLRQRFLHTYSAPLVRTRTNFLQMGRASRKPIVPAALPWHL